MSPLVILVVEDEPILRLDAVDLLTDAGHIVLEAANADEAIALLETRPDITVLFTDIEMPGSMDGMKLARAVRDRWPPVMIIVASGRVLPGAGELPDNVPYLPKPYSPEAMLKAVCD
ncbi:hypothetical protein ASE63_25425 [Bosea sp. Root381]|uniref:response regulator n=1 Tax=Bosea sp. Root381 TaxID=1736524 RepID=UPI0006F57A96|nr:response regulator [Bosea sp. Root381]KRE04363.1 hypothetical protein ASE63_25425 [Bosea sp. Root381]